MVTSLQLPHYSNRKPVLKLSVTYHPVQLTVSPLKMQHQNLTNKVSNEKSHFAILVSEKLYLLTCKTVSRNLHILDGIAGSTVIQPYGC